ncbi:LytR/AlgR family response regulator transcription factor [Pontibacter cellulosilyticus]|uniref:LytTR family transcriptional regulator n=1 Tax=Pontibacter cellulosilyticus TaxID=1720253 RepID=A0A923N4C2_9BACT|nr:LytTR family DNA-binding domain-containing protein [Pontibacter cellulosilyticus]MBC5992001.1 LytTR family transcriptional regulator [Pontibacter cellulosilyticus]
MHNYQLYFSNWRHLLVLTLLVLVLVHLISPANFPFIENYNFPWRDFAVHFIGTLILWELQMWTIRNVYKKGLFENGFSMQLLLKVLGINMGIFALLYLCYAPFVTVVVYGRPISLYALLVGLLLSVVLALVINGIYLSLELYNYWQERQAAPTQPQEQATAEATPPKDTLVLQAGKEQVQVPVQQLAYFYSENKITFAVFTTGRRMATNYTLSELEPLLPPQDFFKISRQVISHRQAIQSVKKDVNFKLLLTLQAEGQPPRTETVSRYKAAEFKDWFTLNG